MNHFTRIIREFQDENLNKNEKLEEEEFKLEPFKTQKLNKMKNFHH